MKFVYLLTVFFTLLILEVSAQCPPAGFPQPGNTCVTAPILCANIDGYCATINNNNQQQNFPGCPGFVLNNDEWFAFIAGTTSISIEVIPSNCTSNGSNQGMQGGIYDNCVSQPMDLQCSCTENPFILNSNNFVIGELYYFVVDGCGGDVCDYEVNVLSGSTVPPPPANAGPVSGPIKVCVGTSSTYTTPSVSGATIYNWTLSPTGLGTLANGTGTSKVVTWGNTPGTVQVCVSTANACNTNPFQSCLTVEIIPRPTAAISGSGILCQGSSTPVNLTVTFTGEGPWTFVYTRNGVPQPPITTSVNPYTLVVTQPGTYALQSINTSAATNCAGTVSGSAVVTQVTLNLSTSTVAANCGLSNGSITTTASGGNMPYTFSWSNGPTTQNQTNVPGGTYTVTMTDANGCTRTATATVANNPINFSVTGSTTANTTCLPPGNGSININVAPAGTYTYEWSNGPTTQNQTNVAPGTYTVTVSAGGTCTQVQSFTVADNPNLPGASTVVVNTTCDLPNGSINLTASGGVSPYTFSWSGGETTEDLSNLLAGTYTFTVTGANGCTRSAPVTVSNTNPPFTVTPTIVANTTCTGGNGSITLGVSPAGTYTFNWGGGQTTNSIANQPAGTYDVTVSAGGSCTQVQSYTIPDNPNLPNLTNTVVNTTCDLSNGSINLSVSGGVAPYTFVWDSGPTTEDLSNIPAGSYAVTVTGANGCTRELTITVSNTNPPFNVNPTIVANTNCNGTGTGSISLGVTPAGTYTFNWGGGQTTSSIANQLPGTYDVTVSAGGSCTQVQSYTIPDNPNLPNLTNSVVNTTCDLSNGSINLSVSGGVAPYTYLWGGGQTSQDLASIPAGSYQVTVTGANGCSQSTAISVDNNNPPFNINPTIVASTTCNAAGNGSISLGISPGGTYTFIWNNNSTNPNQANLSPGTYTVTVSAGGSCTQEASFDVPSIPNLPNPTYSAVESTCDLANGSINLSVTGGVPPYTYLWSSGQTSQDIANLLAGSYQVTVTGANGCSNVADVAVDNNNPVFNINGTVQPSTTCNGTGNGSITVSATPAGTYTYVWSTGPTTPGITGLLPGVYVVTVSAGGSCIQSADFLVPEEPNEPQLDFIPTDSRCELPNGSINLTVIGGVAPYTYLWSNSQTIQDLNNIVANTYTVTVTGSNGCSTVGSVDVNNEQIPILVNADITDNTSCIPPNNGRIALTITPANATVIWSTGSTAKTLNNLGPGEYTVTVSVGGTCIEVLTYAVGDGTELPELYPDVTDANCGLNNGAIEMDVVNGATPYKFKWSNGLTTQNLSNLLGGTYTFTVTTALGCTAVTSVVVPDNPITINIFGLVEPNTSCGNPDGSIYIDTDPNNFPFKYKWSTGPTTKDLLSLSPGVYTITITIGTCSASEPFEIENAAFPPNLSAAGTPTTCGQNNGTATATASGGVTPYKYKWSANASGATTQTVNNLIAGTYTVTVTGDNGCTATSTVAIPNNNIPVNITAALTENTSCTVGNGAINISLTPVGVFKFKWSNGPITEDISGLDAGIYTVTATLGVSCTTTAVYTVLNNTSDPVITPAITASICGASNGSVNLTVSGGGTPYQFLWSNTDTTQNISNVLAGNYSVTVTAANGCTADTTLNVSNQSNTFTLAGVAAPHTNCPNPDGFVNITVTPIVMPAGTFTYTWSNAAVTEDLTGLPTGTYTVTVSQVGSTCTASASYVVDDERTYPTLSHLLQPEVCGLLDGDIALSVSGGATPYTYVWSNMASSPSLANIAAGTYTVTVTGANGCTTTDSADVPANSISFSLSGITATNTACAPSNGGIDLSVSPAGTYTFEWSSGPKTEDLSVISGGTYAVTVSAGGTCTSVASFTVPDNTDAPILSQAVTSASCAKSNGGINLTVSGSTTPFLIKWSSGPTTEDLSNIPSGDYSVTVTGANGCVSTKIFTVPENVISPSISGIPAANTACGTNNGSIALSVTPADIYTFTWQSGQTTQNLTAIAAGIYTVTVSSGGACTATSTFEVLNATDAPVISPSLTESLCSSPSGAIALGVSGSTTPYTFAWSNGKTTKDLTGLVPGTYTVTATGSNGCVSTASFTVTEQVVLPQITGNTAPNTACSAPTGTATINVTPVATYTFTWSNGPTTQNLTGLPEGSYTVTVSGGGSCVSTATFDVQNATDVPIIAPNIKPSLCSQPDGAIDLTVTGATTPYVFKWAHGPTTEDLSGILSGTYTVTVSAANGCTATASLDVANNSNTFSITGVEVTNTLCFGGNGSLNLTVTPPDAYTFGWSNAAITEDLSALKPGTYTVTVTDPGKCVASATFVIFEEAKAVQAAGTTTNILCFGENKGAIDLTVSVGSLPFIYKWSPVQPGNLQDLTNIPAGNYAVTVTDALNCTGTAAFSVTQPQAALTLACTMTKVVTQPGGADGAAAVTISGGTAPYTINWSPGGSLQSGVPAGAFPIPNLTVGSYTTTVTDANGCSSICNFNVGLEKCETVVGAMGAAQLSLCGPGCITATYNAALQYLQPNDVLQFVLHTGTSNQVAGEIARSTQPTFCFDPTTMTYGSVYRISAAAGNNDGSGNVVLADYCTVVSFGTPIVFNEKPVADIMKPNPITCVTLEVNLVGSSSIAGSVFDWKTTNGTIIGNPAAPAIQAGKKGLYTLYVTANGCADTSSVQVLDLRNDPKAVILPSPDDVLDCKINEIILSGQIEGTLNANTIWLSNGQIYSNGNPVMINEPGIYVFIVLDTISLCRDTATIVIDENQAYPPLSVNPPGLLTCKNTVVTLSGGSSFPGVQFRWGKINGADTTIIGTGTSISITTPGTYVFIGFDPNNGCTNSQGVPVNADVVKPTADAGAGFTVECFGEIAQLDGTGSTGLPGFLYLWTTGNGKLTANVNSATPTINKPGTYQLLVTNPSNGCTDTDDVVIAPEVPVPNLFVQQPRCFGDQGAFTITSVAGGKPPFRYSLDSGQTFTSLNKYSNLTPGSTYSIFIIDSEGCTATSSVTMNNPVLFNISINPEIARVALGDSYTIEPEVSVPLSQVGFVKWEPSNQLDCDTCLIATIDTALNTTFYKLVAADTSGCTDVAFFRIYVDKEPHVYIPNIFTPNNDGENDLFTIFGDLNQVVKIKSFQIYSRWGEQVFEQYNFVPDGKTGWDGRHRGNELNPAVFVWYAEVEFIDGNVVLYKGDVTLSR